MSVVRSVRRATNSPPKPTAEDRNTSAAPGNRDNRPPLAHLPPPRLVSLPPQVTRRKPERQQCELAPRAFFALDRHKDAVILQCTTTRPTPRVGRQATCRVNFSCLYFLLNGQVACIKWASCLYFSLISSSFAPFCNLLCCLPCSSCFMPNQHYWVQLILS